MDEYNILNADPEQTAQKPPSEEPFTLSPEDKKWLEDTYGKLEKKMQAQNARVGSMIPYSPKDGVYHDLDTPGGISFWTNGFYPGMLWQMYSATGDESYRKNAEEIEKRLEENLVDFENLDHDIGFLFLPTAVANYQITGNEKSKRNALHAANLLAGRYNPAGKYIRAWNDTMWTGDNVSGWMIIDCMMNIPLLFWASEESNDPRFKQFAYNHAKTAQEYIVRPDGSCNHIIIFDPETGEFLDNPGGQGFGKGSSWSRGQSWALYGFALAHRYTGDESFLDTAKKVAHYAISNLAVNDWLPLVDYRAPEEPVKYDSTAGMITAAGLLELAEHVGEYEKKLYTKAALNILKSCEKKFANWNPEEDSIIDKGTFFYHDPTPTAENTEVPIIYADYYFIDALLRLLGKGRFIG